MDQDWELYFAATRSFAVPGVSPHYATPLAFNELLRSRLKQRNRFNHDHHDTCMYIARSKNANVVAYTANLSDAVTNAKVGSGIGRRCVVRRDDPLHAYFVNLEPSYVEDRRRKGVEYDCDDLNMLERKLAYGCTATPVDLEAALRLWGKQLPDALTSLQEAWRAAGGVGVPPTEVLTPTKAEAEAASNRSRRESSSSAKPTSPTASSTAESLEAVLRTWWASFHPFVSHFVALPTWPGLLLSLPPLSAMGGPSRQTSTLSGAATPPKVTSPTAQNAETAAVAAPEDDPTNATYGAHVEPAPVTDTTGILGVEDTVVVIVATIAGELSIVERVYVQSTEPKRFYQLPKVEYIEVFGVSVATGEPTYEKKTS